MWSFLASLPWESIVPGVVATVGGWFGAKQHTARQRRIADALGRAVRAEADSGAERERVRSERAKSERLRRGELP